MPDNDIYERIRQRLKALDLSERKASMMAAGNPELIRNIRRGKSMSPRSGNLVKLARVLEVSESWLLGTSDDDSPPSDPPRGVAYGGIVEAGAFRPVNMFDQEGEYRTVSIAPDSRFPVSVQHVFEVVGDSMLLAGLAPGMWALAVDLHSYEKIYGEPGDGKLVVVARIRDGDRELTVKRLRIFRDRMELQPESPNPMHKPIVFPWPPRDDGPSEAAIVAVVLQAVYVFG